MLYVCQRAVRPIYNQDKRNARISSTELPRWIGTDATERFDCSQSESECGFDRSTPREGEQSLNNRLTHSC